MTYHRKGAAALLADAALLGALAIIHDKTEGMPGVEWNFPQPGEQFIIEKHPGANRISCANAVPVLNGETCALAYDLDSAADIPVFCTHVGNESLWDDLLVINEQGELTPEFMQVLAGQR